MTLRIILGDQLNEAHSWFSKTEDATLYVMMELRSETDYVPHHIQKVIGFFAAMRLFAARLRAQGHTVRYFQLDDADNAQGFEENIRQMLADYPVDRVECQEPDEYRLDQVMQRLGQYCATAGIAFQMTSSEHFFAERAALARLFSGKKNYLMEHFYRKMREKHQILMEPDGKTPVTGRWNYDAENRKKLPQKVQIPPAPTFYRDVSDIALMIHVADVKTIGHLDAKAFNWPVTRTESLALLEAFVQFRLPFFGDFQDAMTSRDWLLFHSKLSFALNVKLITPKEVVEKCITYQKSHPDLVPFSALEGFIRQILGWREYMRGIYWAEMPTYRSLNFFDHQAPLPSWFWTGKTQMFCLQQTIDQSLERAYAHHIQRLMVTGAFTLLLGVHPDAVDEWYLGIYMDAIEWVEITNTRGMSQYADGGIVGSKPYVGSANYIDKMSDYCQQCHYDKSKRHGHRACPFNSLYWDFHDRHREKLSKNPRIGMVYNLLNKMDADELGKIRTQAAFYKAHVDTL